MSQKPELISRPASPGKRETKDSAMGCARDFRAALLWRSRGLSRVPGESGELAVGMSSWRRIDRSRIDGRQ